MIDGSGFAAPRSPVSDRLGVEADSDRARRFRELSRRLLRRAAALQEERPRLRSGDDVVACLQCRRVPGRDGDVFVREVRRTLSPQSFVARGAGDLSALVAPSRAVVVDVETVGLANAPILLVGCAWVSGGDLLVRQFLAADYGAEPFLLDLSFAEMARADAVLTFNGTTFDVPALALRGVMFGRAGFRPRRHIDLLHLARRRYRGLVENCRLQTLETAVLGRPRPPDVPSKDVPALFHRFIRSGDPADIVPVVRHNEEDLVSMAGLAGALGVLHASREPGAAPGDPVATDGARAAI